jgi:putative ATPase
VIYLAVAPKSNAGYKAYNKKRALVKSDSTRPVPMHLRNAPTKLMKELDYGKGYRYAHDEEGGLRPASAICPMAWTSSACTSPCRAAWKSRSARSWPSCAR